MTQEEQLRQQRQALNAALNNHDLKTATSFFHADFVAQGTDGHSYNRQEALRQLEQFLKPSFKLQSKVEVEHVEVSGDSSKLRVRRTESGRMYRPEVFWGFLALAAYLAYNAIKSASRFAGEKMTLIDFWVAIVAAAVVCPLAIWGAFYLGRRSMHQTQRAEETWRSVDGRWLLAEEHQLS